MKKIDKDLYFFCIWEFAVVIIFYFVLGIEWTSRYQKIHLFIIAICTLPLCILIHEMIHYFVIRIFYREKVKFGIERNGLWIKYVYIHSDGKLFLWQWVLVKIAPAVLLSIIPTCIMKMSGYRSMMAFCIVTINFAACYKDFIDLIYIIKNRRI